MSANKVENEYTIKGSISIKITTNAKDVEYALVLSPNAGYYSADQKCAIFFPSDDNKCKMLARLRPMEDKKCNFKELDKELGALLFQIASQQKPIELKVNDSCKIIGFTYPI